MKYDRQLELAGVLLFFGFQKTNLKFEVQSCLNFFSLINHDELQFILIIWGLRFYFDFKSFTDMSFVL